MHPVAPGFGGLTPPAAPDANPAATLGEAELNPEPAPPRPTFGRRLRAIARLKRETRFALAVSLSFVILVTVLMMNLGKAKAGKAPPIARITQNNAPAQQFASDLKGAGKDEDSPTTPATAEPPVAAAPSPAPEAVTELAAPPLDKVLLTAAPKPAEGNSGTADREAPPQIAEASPKDEEKGPIAQLPELPATVETPATTPPQTPPAATTAPPPLPTPTPAAPIEEQPATPTPAAAVETAAPPTPDVKPSDASPAPPAGPGPSASAGNDPPANPSPAASAPTTENPVPPTPAPVTPAAPAPEPTQAVPLPQNPPPPSPVEPANSGNTGVVPNTADASVKAEPPASSAAFTSAPSATEPVPMVTPRTEPTAQESVPSSNPETGGKEEWVVIPNVRARRSAAAVTERSDPLASAIESAEPLDSGAIDRDRVEPLPHVVQKGENFWTISRKYYRTGRYWKALWAANRQKVSAPDQLYVGTTIRVPPPELLDRTLVEPPSTVRSVTSSVPSVPLRKTSRPVLNDEQPGAKGSRNTEESQVLTLPLNDSFSRNDSEREEWGGTEPDPRSGRLDERHRRPVYKVRPYDTLRSIARDTLDDPRRADEILELNEDVIDDPRHLIPGQIIELPEDARISRRLR